MKQFLLLSAYAFFGFTTAFAQGTLQFNQVLNLEIPSTVETTFTVPSGKVWKIISATYTSYSYPMRISKINGNSTTLYITNYIYGSNNIYPGVLPYWVPGSTSISFIHGASANYKSSVSVIEFNVVP
ncbi:MAG: hypothetical protein IT223_02795 [Crocinitomicaceae bacterium]|nr:hypothetical protein [Crocinitomicaceae bacterium]